MDPLYMDLVDLFSNWAEAISIPNHTAATVDKALMVNVFARFGMPAKTLSDRGTEFESESVYDANVREQTYTVGEAVWYYYPRRYTKKSPKWQRCYIGPYRVTQVLPPVNYVIQRSPKSKPFVVHADKLKKCYSAPTSDWTVSERSVESGLAATTVPPSPPAHQLESRPARRREL